MWGRAWFACLFVVGGMGVVEGGREGSKLDVMGAWWLSGLRVVVWRGVLSGCSRKSRREVRVIKGVLGVRCLVGQLG